MIRAQAIFALCWIALAIATSSVMSWSHIRGDGPWIAWVIFFMVGNFFGFLYCYFFRRSPKAPKKTD